LSKNWIESYGTVVVWDSKKSVVRKERIESSSPVLQLVAMVVWMVGWIAGGKGTKGTLQAGGVQEARAGDAPCITLEAFSRTFSCTPFAVTLKSRGEKEICGSSTPCVGGGVKGSEGV
jgi:hypothetical protein